MNSVSIQYFKVGSSSDQLHLTGHRPEGTTAARRISPKPDACGGHVRVGLDIAAPEGARKILALKGVADVGF
jgi:hypothetical protein